MQQQTAIKLRLRMSRQPLHIHLHLFLCVKYLEPQGSRLLKPSLNQLLLLKYLEQYGIASQFPYEIRHKLVELFKGKRILIVVYVIIKCKSFKLVQKKFFFSLFLDFLEVKFSAMSLDCTKHMSIVNQHLLLSSIQNHCT